MSHDIKRVIVCTSSPPPHPPFSAGDWASNQIFKKGGAWQDLLEGVAGKEGDDFYQGAGGSNFYIINELKFEIFNDKKKFISKNIFLCHN